jgi:hypothetical protein
MRIPGFVAVWFDRTSGFLSMESVLRRPCLSVLREVPESLTCSMCAVAAPEIPNAFASPQRYIFCSTNPFLDQTTLSRLLLYSTSTLSIRFLHIFMSKTHTSIHDRPLIDP